MTNLELAQQINRRDVSRPLRVGSRLDRTRLADRSRAVAADALEPALRGAGGLPACRISPPKAKRVIYLFQSGAPSQIDLFDYKPATRRSGAAASCPTRSAWASGSRR